MGPKTHNAFYQNRTQDTWEKMGKRNEQTRRWVQKENRELIVIATTRENEDEEEQWNRKRWVLLIEIFMYLGNAYILSWHETTVVYTLLGTLITREWKTIG